MTKKKIYIAGKVTGLPQQEVISKFAKAQKEIEDLGCQAVNPIEEVGDFNTPWNTAMKICIISLLDCDAVYLINDWWDSTGAKLEVQISEKMDVKILKSHKALVLWTS